MNQRTRFTKQLLKTSLLDMLREKSIHKISVRELCQNAGVNRSTFYKYYESPYALMSELCSEIYENVVENFPPTTSIAKELEKLLCYYNKNLAISRLLLNNSFDSTLQQRLFDTIYQNARTAYQKDMTDTRFDYVFKYCHAGARAIVLHWLNKEERESPAEMALLLEKLFSHCFDVKQPFLLQNVIAQSTSTPPHCEFLRQATPVGATREEKTAKP